MLLNSKEGRQTVILLKKNKESEYHGEVDFIKEELGLSMYLNPERILLLKFQDCSNFPSAIEVDTFVKGVELLKIEIPENSILVGKNYGNFQNTSIKVFVCTVQRENEVKYTWR